MTENAKFSTRGWSYRLEAYTHRVSQVKWNLIPQLQRFFSIVLLAACDADYYFTLFDLGSHGSNNDCDVLANSLLEKGLKTKKIQLPPDEP